MDIFAIVPASTKPLWWIAIICLILLVIILVLFFAAYSSQTSKVEIDSQHLRLKGDFWGREIPISKLNISATEIINLDENLEFRPKRRTWGTGLPGYASGWFRLRNGEKALLYLTTHDNVVYIPTHEDYSLLLSVKEPNEFINKLKSY